MTEDPKVTKMIDNSLIHEKEGPDRGRVKDVAAAEELAQIEATKELVPLFPGKKNLPRV